MKVLASVGALATGLFLILQGGQWAMGMTLISLSALVESGVTDRIWDKLDEEYREES